MASIIDIETGEIVEPSISFPYYYRLPDDGLALFEKPGDERPEGAPQFRAVEEVVMSAAPIAPSIVIDTVRAYVNGRIEISHTYKPDASAYQREIERKIESIAAERGYSSAVSAASYVSSSVPQWAAEASAFVAFRDAVWAYALGELAKVQAGQRQPPSLAALIAELPAMEWPA
jgi:hypothetical protein